MTDETKKEIAAFLRERMIAEQKRFHEFVEHMTNKGFYGGSVFVKFNDGIRLVTIRHYDENSEIQVLKMFENEEVIIRQNNRHTIQLVLKKNS